MENLNRRIKSEMNRFSAKSLLSDGIMKKLNMPNRQIYLDYDNWISNLKNSMRLCKYRTVIAEIELKKNNFKKLIELHWKYQYIEIDAIFKIVKKKIMRHKTEIAKEGSHHYNSCLFWFNQIILILEQLTLELRPDLNKMLDYNKKKIIGPIQCAIDSFIKLFYLLIVFSHYNQQLPEILSYFSITEKLVPYMKFTSKSTSYILMQKIQLFKVKILAQNCDYYNAINNLEFNIDFCYDFIKILSDDKFNVYIFDLSNEKNIKYLENLKKKRLFKIYEYKGFIKQNDNDKNNDKSDLEIKTRKDLIELNKRKLKNIEKLKEMNKKNEKKVTFMNKKKYTNLELKKISSSISNFSNNTNSSNNIIMKQSEEQKTFITQPLIKVKKIKTKKIKKENINRTVIIERNKKKQVTMKKIDPLKKKKKNKRTIIEEVLINMALNFYLRGAIFEHYGNIDSALDSYKEVEWFALKFLSNKYPSFVKYTTSLLNYAWSNYNMIYEIRYEKVKLKKKNEIIKDIELIKEKEKMEAQERHEEELFHFKSNKLLNNKKLNNFLTDLGSKIYKEEEQRNFNIYNRFTTNEYILSTYKMVNDLLSDDFRQILMKMKKVEITKPNEEIKDQIDKTLMKIQHQYVIKESEKNENNIISNTYNKKNNNNITNTKSNLIFIKENNNSSIINQKNDIVPIKRVKFNIKSLGPKEYKTNDKSLTNTIENSTQKVSTSCEMINNKLKNTSLIHSYKDFTKKYYNNHLNTMNSQNKNTTYKFSKKRNKNKSEIQKVRSSISCFKSGHTKEKVERYFVDKNNFSKRIIRKKIFLDKYSNKDFSFLKDMLETKSFLEEYVKPIDDLELKNVRKDAEINFYSKLEIAKSGQGKKNLNNLIKQKINILNNNKNKKFIENKSETPSEDSEKDININNNAKLQKIENDYNNIIQKRNKLIKRKKRKINPSKSFYK